MNITISLELLITIGINSIVIIAGIAKIERRLTRMETDIKWIKGECPKCPQTSDTKTA